MADLGACGRRSHGGAAGIGKEVEDVGLFAAASEALLDHLGDEIPVGALLGEDAGVLEAHGLDVEGDGVSIADLPLFGQVEYFPAAAAGVAAVVDGIDFIPLLGGFPDGLGIGTDKQLLAPALVALALAAVEELIIFPVGCDPHSTVPFRFIDIGHIGPLLPFYIQNIIALSA